jgi:hypothetical protein
MVRFAFAGLAMLVLLGGAVAAEEDNGPALVDLFAKTCALRPALPSEMERIALGVGLVSVDPITADMESGPRIDILYTARLIKRGEKVGSLTAYFEGPADSPTVSCGISAVGVSAEALPALVEKSLNAHHRAEKTPADEKRLQASWRIGAKEGDMLDVSAWRTSPQRASISFNYRGAKKH